MAVQLTSLLIHRWASFPCAICLDIPAQCCNDSLRSSRPQINPIITAAAVSPALTLRYLQHTRLALSELRHGLCVQQKPLVRRSIRFAPTFPARECDAQAVGRRSDRRPNVGGRSSVDTAGCLLTGANQRNCVTCPDGGLAVTGARTDFGAATQDGQATNGTQGEVGTVARWSLR